MKLTKLEIYGFKSFADKLEIDFGEGITAIVGPNGCGKSNVSDAVRWILGEQSAKQLRGKGMQDLIFGGTESRKSMSYCEASLYFDNSDKFLPVEFEQVCITRKLYKSGESEYLLNRKPVRLRDLLDVLRDAGMGNDGYTVVGQGRMDAILNAKPENRRAIFEEALGISKFRVRKGETKRKLERAEVNMNRLRDIMSVLERQMLPLMRQAEDAKKYLSLRDELKHREINAYLYNYDNASSNKERFVSKIEAIASELAYNEERYAQATEQYDSLHSKIAELDKELSDINEKATQAKVELERKAGEQNVKLERIKAFEANLASYLEQVKEAQAQKKEKGERMWSLNISHVEAMRASDRLYMRVEDLDSRLSNLSKLLEEKREYIQSQGEGVLELIDKLTRLKSERASLLAERLSIEQRKADIEEERQRLLDKLGSLSQSERSELDRLQGSEAEVETLKRSLDTLEANRRQQSDKLHELRSILEECTRQELKAGVSADMLKNTVENYGGYSETVKRLLTASQKDVELKRRILGSAASVMKVPEQYEKAISAALGGATQNIVTKNEEDARYIIEYLRRGKAGRVTFLPLNTVKQSRFTATHALKERGALTAAENAVECEERFKPVVYNLLGGTLIVDNAVNATAIAAKFGYSFRIVTLTGEVFSTQGRITGGEQRGDEINAISAKRLLAQAEEQHKLKVQARVQAQARETAAREEYSAIKERCAVESERLKSAELELAALKERVQGSTLLSENERASLARLAQEDEKLEQRLADIQEQESLKQGDIKLLSKKREGMTNVAEKDRREYERLSARIEEYREAALESRVAMVEKEGECKAIELESDTLEQDIDRLNKVIKEKTAAAESVKAALELTEKELYQENSGKGLYDELSLLTETVKIKNALKEQLNGEFITLDKERVEINNSIMRLMQAKSREQFNLEKIDSELETMQERILEDYGLSYSAALRFRDEEYNPSGSKKEINRLRSEIASLGNVNINAIEQYKEIKEEYDEDLRQLQDLEKAGEDLNKILNDLTKEMTLRFNRGFEKISQNFSLIFKELFGGGKAEMRIEKDPEKEEMDYGIEIEAQPPGKKLQSISLLSGGERALTCISILFAILRLNPMPFCVLDEIEAPLDDSNALRVAKYIEKFADETQFLVITHKKPTMESANRLFGVTMQEKGVSKIVSVQLKEAFKHTSPA